MDIYFSDIFSVTEEVLEEYGAFNVSLIADLPLFIDPFLLFNSDKAEYRKLHDQIIDYLRFLRDKSISGEIRQGSLKAWYHFPEVKQTWLGFSKTGNSGRGLGSRFARSLADNLETIFNNFGNEKITHGSHLEKLCLIKEGVGRDMISDFTTNLIKNYLLSYTERFAQSYLDNKLCRMKWVDKSEFNGITNTWRPKQYLLPVYNNEFVILTPKDLLTKDDTWISRSDFYDRFEDIPYAVENAVLREEINNYFYRMIPKEPTKEDINRAMALSIRKYPILIDYYIRMKEESGDDAVDISQLKVADSYKLYVRQFGEIANLLKDTTEFYKYSGKTKYETKLRIKFFKDVIENKGGYRLFYLNGVPIAKEEEVQILFRFVWYATDSDVSREVNDGRGPADYKLSKGAYDKTLVEFKLAKNTQLKRNLQNQLEIYKKASDADTGYKVIIYFNYNELNRVLSILEDLSMDNDPNIFLIDARNENKPSGSKA